MLDEMTGRTIKMNLVGAKVVEDIVTNLNISRF
jgi:hypothetical protein